MCLVSVLPKGTKKYNEKVIAFVKSGMSSNRDGSGYMYKRNGSKKITISKGYFDIDKLLEAIKDENLQDDDEMVIHHRISTAGKVTAENCHPFVLSTSHLECCATDITIDKPCLAHNGHFSRISLYQDLDRDFSDTYAFARYILSNKSLQKLLDEDEILFETVLDNILGSSKIAILYPNKDLKTIGTFQADEGYFHSNYGYKTYTCDRGGSSTWNKNKYRNKHWNMWNEGYNNEDEDETQEAVAMVVAHAMNEKKLLEAAKSKNDTNSSVGRQLTLLDRALKLDNTLIDLSKMNFNHFLYLKKDDFPNANLATLDNFLTIDEFDADCEFQRLKRIESTDIGTFPAEVSILTEHLNKDYYYFPKLTYTEIYKMFLDLVNATKDKKLGKSTVKKLEKLLFDKIMLTNDTKIMYHKTGVFYPKLSLILYKEYLLTKKRIGNTFENFLKVLS